ncbi:hypothetical protein RhiirC2_719628 [Rhizophagus irregularis]|uniref:Uncharacterized protein n=1 Tax=Rhizophagus irregularis TaxID=588596 RepID=A0A2N1MDJ0_9GLOM|nr:hypothetical protein RhiirC2_719628 [Rhizophagus irregularis]
MKCIKDLRLVFPKVCQLYGLGETDDLSLLVFLPFICECEDLKDDSSRRPISSPINGNEASKLQYISSYLVAGVNLYEGKFELRPEKSITAPFAMDLFQTAKAVGVIEVEDEDILKGITQNAIQLESALSNCIVLFLLSNISFPGLSNAFCPNTHSFFIYLFLGFVSLLVF